MSLTESSCQVLHPVGGGGVQQNLQFEIWPLDRKTTNSPYAYIHVDLDLC